jgi:cytochrome c oxidase cbb3-type subunit I/II
MSTGFSGTPMPSYRDSLPEQDRWALAYYVISLSAFKDPLTLQPLPISPTDRAALNDPKLEAATPEDAYVPGGGRMHRAELSGAATGRPEGASVSASGGTDPLKKE